MESILHVCLPLKAISCAAVGTFDLTYTGDPMVERAGFIGTVLHGFFDQSGVATAALLFSSDIVVPLRSRDLFAFVGCRVLGIIGGAVFDVVVRVRFVLLVGACGPVRVPLKRSGAVLVSRSRWLGQSTVRQVSTVTKPASS
jgi:hypothetical protein